MRKWQFPEGYDETAEDDFAGFVYLITNELTGRAYVGRKAFKAKVRGSMRASNWRTYYGSCKPLKADIAEFGKERFRREIVSFHKTDAGLNYGEVVEQFRRDVLAAKLPDGSPAFYNGNIAHRWFAAKAEMSPEHRAKISASKIGKKFGPLSAEHREKIASAQRGKPKPKPDAAWIEKRARARNRFNDETVRAVRGSSKTLTQIMAEHDISMSHASRMRAGKSHPWVD